MQLELAAQHLVEKGDIIIRKLEDYFFIMYEENKFSMTKYTNQFFSSREEFMDKVFGEGLEPQDFGFFEGENDLNTAEASIIDFLNVYCSFEFNECDSF